MVDNSYGPKVLVIGNSFAAALRESVDASRHNISFLGGSNQFLNHLELGDDGDSLVLDTEMACDPVQKRLWYLTSGSEKPLQLSNFDIFIVVGNVNPPDPLLHINCIQIDKDIACFFKGAPVSFALYKKISPYRGSLERAKKIKQLICNKDVSRKVLFVPQPNIRDDAADFDVKYTHPDWWKRLDQKSKLLLQENEQALYKRYFLDEGIMMVMPTDEVVVDGNRCPSRFSIGALGSANFVSGTKPQWGNTPLESVANMNHKNAEWGSIIWRQIDHMVSCEYF